MKTKSNILFVCAHDEIRETVLRLINTAGHWQVEGSADIEEAIARFCQVRFDLVLIGSGLSEAEEEKMCRLMRLRDPKIRIMQHYGGGSGLLWNEIREAFERDAVMAM